MSRFDPDSLIDGDGHVLVFAVKERARSLARREGWVNYIPPAVERRYFREVWALAMSRRETRELAW